MVDFVFGFLEDLGVAVPCSPCSAPLECLILLLKLPSPQHSSMVLHSGDGT